MTYDIYVVICGGAIADINVACFSKLICNVCIFLRKRLQPFGNLLRFAKMLPLLPAQLTLIALPAELCRFCSGEHYYIR